MSHPANHLLSPRPGVRKAVLAAALSVLALLLATPASARDDHERAREAVQSGQIQPLRYILETLERTHPGKVLEVELERRRDQWMYEVKLLQPDGRLVKLRVDAKTAEVLR